MALGTIPIVSDIAPNREWVKHGINGFLVDIHNIDNVVDTMSFAVTLKSERINEMRNQNREIIQRRGSLSRNMSRFIDRVIQDMQGRK